MHCGLAQRVLCAVAFGDITDHGHQITVRHHRGNDVRGKHAGVFAPKLPFAVVAGVAADFLQSGADVGVFFRNDDVRCMQADEFGVGVAEHAANAGVGVQVVAVNVGNQNTVGGVLKQCAVACFTLQQREFAGQLLLGCVTGKTGGHVVSHVVEHESTRLMPSLQCLCNMPTAGAWPVRMLPLPDPDGTTCPWRRRCARRWLCRCQVAAQCLWQRPRRSLAAR